jgi:hypothetical protein
VGALLVQVISGAYSAFTIGPEAAAEMLRQLGWDVGGAPIDPTVYYAGALGFSCCAGLLAVAVLAGLGALGGAIWYQSKGKAPLSTPAPM